VHIVILEEWSGTTADSNRAWGQVKEDLRTRLEGSGKYVWHHEEIVDANGRKGVKLVLVPRELNSIPHSGPASWQRAALKMGRAAKAKLPKLPNGIGNCLRVLGVVGIVFDPIGAVAGPQTTMGDATYSGEIEREINLLQSQTNSPEQYRQALIRLRALYGQSKYMQHFVPHIEMQLDILRMPASPYRPPNQDQPPAY